MAKHRITIDDDTLNALEDAVSYYLSCAGDNFGSGWTPGHDEELQEMVDSIQIEPVEER